MSGNIAESAESPSERQVPQDPAPIKLAVDNSISSTPAPPKSQESKPPAGHDLRNLLRDSRELLDYATQAGIVLEDAVVQTILTSIEKAELTDAETVAAIKAMTTLATKLKPVTAATLKVPKKQADSTLRFYFLFALILGIPLIALSALSFITASLSKSIGDEIATANQLAVTLNADTTVFEPGAAAKQILDLKTLTTLQLFAATIRKVDGLSLQLQPLVRENGRLTDALTTIMPKGTRPESILELRVPATLGQIKEKTEQFQLVRAYATQLRTKESVFYGAVANCILPSLYAILGACAYLLKTFSEQVRARSFLPYGDSDRARFIIAAIGGGVVGLFNNFTLNQGTSLSLLAIAFLIGYATEVFFSFLDGLQQVFTKPKPS